MSGLTGKIAFFASASPEGQQALAEMQTLYGGCKQEDAEIFVALGGDGTMLETLHGTNGLNKPVFGMNRGSVGFLMNPYKTPDLPERLEKAQSVTIYPLEMIATDKHGKEHRALAFNEVSLLRESRHAAKLSVFVDGIERLPELICDGILVATPVGSTAYNFSVGGPIIPLGSPITVVTPISPFRPRGWRGAVLPERTAFSIGVIEAGKRPVSATADFTEIRDVVRVDIREARAAARTLLFDPGHGLDERIIKEQFMP